MAKQPAVYDLSPPTDLPPETALLWACLQQGTREWRDNLQRCPPRAIMWQPCPSIHSIGAVMLHMAGVEAFWIEQVGADKNIPVDREELYKAKEIRQYGEKWPEAYKLPLAWYYDMLDERREQTRRTVYRLSDPLRRGRYRSAEFTLRWILNHLIAHEAYHGGQAALLYILYRKQRRTAVLNK